MTYWPHVMPEIIGDSSITFKGFKSSQKSKSKINKQQDFSLFTSLGQQLYESDF